MEKITNQFWDFIEKYLPGYCHRDDVLRQSDLELFIDGQESSITDEMDIDEAEDESNHLLYNFYYEAINAYTNGDGIECQYCSSYKNFTYCPICGKKLNSNE